MIKVRKQNGVDFWRSLVDEAFGHLMGRGQPKSQTLPLDLFKERLKAFGIEFIYCLVGAFVDLSGSP